MSEGPQERKPAYHPDSVPTASLSGARTQHSNRRRGNRAFSPDEHVYAALDLGTNNCRLLVARPSRRGFIVVDAFSRVIKLGEGITQSGALSEQAMRRTIDALKVCAEKMIRRGVQRSRLIATEACRVASNAEEFVGRVREETGLELEIIDRETEARLAVSGCASLIDRQSDGALVFDIGGGSSELIFLDLRCMKDQQKRRPHDRLWAQDCVAAWTSLPVGVVTLAEQFAGEPMDQRTFEAMVREVHRALQDFDLEHGVSGRIASGNTHLLGTSGTATTIAGIHLGLEYYDRRRVDGCWLSADQVRAVSERLTAMKHEERVRQGCIGRERADLIVAGAAILEALLRAWTCDRLRVADRGLREGILATLMAEDGVHDLWRRRTRRFRRK
ncbi:exopolyphosphatase/guanosine-5'-triphosphate,3'-diphosphate pyrophosphatase [Dichotomicrobium thermohalophilum]|uniref:Exopolyphosphatase/guanosine-5'-triphosphate, 3'-diphosphate pyrophosphatase n=1 Tax=Dichotomicrobium thermohalophilum TaxID=933063 RepID=A0A397Q5T9_9HYPH|nr:exopolyphosphatase/guanosine-5'-triphosphate,3'-diphosphate pyrophosphatase [Dichotomicrobium thermohalophilum]